MKYNNLQKEAIIRGFLALPTPDYLELSSGNYTKGDSMFGATGEVNFYMGECKAISYGEDGMSTLIYKNGSIVPDSIVEEYELDEMVSATLRQLLIRKPNNTSEDNYKRFGEFCEKIIETAGLSNDNTEDVPLDVGSLEEMLEYIFIDGELELTAEQEYKIRTAYMNLGVIDRDTKSYEKEASKYKGSSFYDFLLFSGICKTIKDGGQRLWCLTSYSQVRVMDERADKISDRVSEALDKLFTEGSNSCPRELYKLFANFCANTLYEEITDSGSTEKDLALALEYIKQIDKSEAYKYQVGSNDHHKILNLIKNNTKSNTNNTSSMSVF